MPTAQDYRTAIAELERRVEAIAAIQRVCDGSREDFGYIGGVASLIRDGFIAGAANASAIGVDCDLLRVELARRASLCDQYTLAMHRYRQAHGAWRSASNAYWDTPADERRWVWLPAEPQPPEPPFVGAQAEQWQVPR